MLPLTWVYCEANLRMPDTCAYTTRIGEDQWWVPAQIQERQGAVLPQTPAENRDATVCHSMLCKSQGCQVWIDSQHLCNVHGCLLSATVQEGTREIYRLQILVETEDCCHGNYHICWGICVSHVQGLQSLVDLQHSCDLQSTLVPDLVTPQGQVLNWRVEMHGLAESASSLFCEVIASKVNAVHWTGYSLQDKEAAITLRCHTHYSNARDTVLSISANYQTYNVF